MGVFLHDMKDYERALAYYQQALRGGEKIQWKTHPDTLRTIKNMAGVCVGFEDFVKAEEMQRLALDGYEKSLGKDHKHTKWCAWNLAVLLAQSSKDRRNMRELVREYPHLMDTNSSVAALLG